MTPSGIEPATFRLETQVSQLTAPPRTIKFTPACFGSRVKFVCLLYSVELGYNIMKGTVYFVSLQTGVVITEWCNVVVTDVIHVVRYKPMSL